MITGYFATNLLKSFFCLVLSEQKFTQVCGDDARTVPPVPIPNTAVKRPQAEGTSLETTRESR